VLRRRGRCCQGCGAAATPAGAQSLDIKKLALAGAGIFATYLGWLAICALFYGTSSRPDFQRDYEGQNNGWKYFKRDRERWNLLHSDQAPRVPYVQEVLSGQQGPFVAATDYKRIVADQESYTVMDDNYYDAWDFNPDSRDSTRRGLGLRIEVRGFQWANPQASNVVFWHYDITNEGTTDYDDNIVFGLYMDSGVGGSALSCDNIFESDDDNAFFDRTLNQVRSVWFRTNGYVCHLLLLTDLFELPGHSNTGRAGKGQSAGDEGKSKKVKGKSKKRPEHENLSSKPLRSGSAFAR